MVIVVLFLFQERQVGVLQMQVGELQQKLQDAEARLASPSEGAEQVRVLQTQVEELQQKLQDAEARRVSPPGGKLTQPGNIQHLIHHTETDHYLTHLFYRERRRWRWSPERRCN
jgi:hypothetical protein